MKDSGKAFIDYCKGYSYREIAEKRRTKLATVKTWSQRGINGKKWTELKSLCINKETNEVDFKKAKAFVAGCGNLNPKMQGQQLMPTQYPEELTRDRELISNTLKECCMYYGVSRPETEIECEQRIISYFTTCINYGSIPTVEGLANSLGIVSGTLWDWEQGKRGTVRADLIKRAKHSIREFDAKLAMKGEIDKTVYIFRAKNYYGMRDEVEQTVTVNNPLGDKGDKNAILERLNSLNDDIE